VVRTRFLSDVRRQDRKFLEKIAYRRRSRLRPFKDSHAAREREQRCTLSRNATNGTKPAQSCRHPDYPGCMGLKLLRASMQRGRSRVLWTTANKISDPLLPSAGKSGTHSTPEDFIFLFPTLRLVTLTLP